MKRLFLGFAVFLGVLGMSLNAHAQSDESDFGGSLAAAAMLSAGADIWYNPAYVGISYPWGDVPANTGVCADVVVRAYRQLGIDLQKRLHEDMKANFSAYPTIWGLSRPDKNIDHRRVLNIEKFFKRKGASLGVSSDPAKFLPGDVVAWSLPNGRGGGLPHIGVVSASKASNGNPKVVHHIGGRPAHEDVLFSWPMTGHYRYRIDEGARDR